MPRVCLLLLAAAAAAVAGNLALMTAVADERPVSESPVALTATLPVPAADGPDFLVGDIDTVGGTTYDWMANGPIYRFICTSPGYGVHILWMYSASTSGTAFPDRNMRYNFFDFAVGEWNWIDPDYMASGVNVYTDRSGYGSLDADPATGVAVCTRHFGTATLQMGAARDMAPGAGIFEYCNGPVGYLWGPVSVGQNSYFHIADMDDPGRQTLYTTQVPTWCTWNSHQSQDVTTFPTQNIAASKVSQKVCLGYVVSNTGAPSPAYYNISTDAGATWQGVQQLPEPPAYGPDTICSFHITSIFPFYDRSDRLHIVAGVGPFVAGQGYVIPAQIWHWSPDNSPNWVRIHTARCNPANLLAPVGYNALYACRPSVGEDRYGGLYVTWEQFDSSNVETQTTLLRADIFYAQDNGNNGQTWNTAVKITDRGTVSHRFPSCVDHFVGDSLYLTYEIDRVAGFYVQGQGSVTNNPIIVHKVPVSVGIKAEPEPVPTAAQLSAGSNPVRGRATLSYAVPRAGRVEMAVFDLSGRPVTTLVSGHREPGRYSANWQAAGLNAGVYVARLTCGAEQVTRKLVLMQ